MGQPFPGPWHPSYQPSCCKSHLLRMLFKKLTKRNRFFFFNTEVQAFPRKTHPKGDAKFAEWPNGTLPRIFPQGNPGLFPRLATLRGILSSLPASPKTVLFRTASSHFILWVSVSLLFPTAVPHSLLTADTPSESPRVLGT